MVTDVKKDNDNIIKEEMRMQAILKEDGSTPLYHLMPPAGWLNDPNGLCEKDGINHIFFQYSPYDVNGKDKYWGHYQTRDFVTYEYKGVFISPDSVEDRDGAYSGSALVDDGEILIYYTGNTKEPGEHDFVYTGRGANTILIRTEDGEHKNFKEVLLKNFNYPERLSCHVRDPKVWKEDNVYYMVLGARTKDNKGTVLLYKSQDKVQWSFERYIETNNKFGYMWECPDMFEIGGKRILSVSPQGLKGSIYKYQNMYQSGYFTDESLMKIKDNNTDTLIVQEENFLEWDMGFDFYAPQTYLDESGRRILIGWMGVPDAEYNNDPSIEKGWQHMLTLPRELVYDTEKGIVRQLPINELEELRKEVSGDVTIGEKGVMQCPDTYELLLEVDQAKDMGMILDDSLGLAYKNSTNEFLLKFYKNGYGRTERRIRLRNGLTSLWLFADRSSLEIFFNSGEYVMTTKFFREEGKKREIHFLAPPKSINCYELTGFNIERG